MRNRAACYGLRAVSGGKMSPPVDLLIFFRQLQPMSNPAADILPPPAVPRTARRTVDLKVQGNPLDPTSSGVMIKPAELVDIIEITPLGLSESRIFNQLIANAWPQITEPVIHKIRKTDLKGTHQSNDRLDDATTTLMRAIAKIAVIQDGEPAVMKVQLLAANIEHDRGDGYFYYKFPPELLTVFGESTIFARLRTQVMYCFTSKYSLRLYELVQKRGNLEYRQSETFALDHLRALMGVPKGKLKSFGEFNRDALKPALREVNSLAEYGVELAPRKHGRKVTHLDMLWIKKDQDACREAMREVERHSAGRRARLAGTVERISF